MSALEHFVNAPLRTTKFAVETYDEIAGDMKPLLDEHWRELALYQDDIPLDPDWDAYKRACDAGVLRLYSVREDGKLIGYAVFVVTLRHLHYAHRWAKDDIVWIAPDHRNYGVGTGLFDFIEADLTKDGPIVISIETKQQHPELAFLLKARGYGDVGMVYGKRFA